MIWYVASDIDYFIKESHKDIPEFAEKTVLVLPKSEEEIIENIRNLNKSSWKDFVVIDSLTPNRRFKDIFVVKELKLKGGFLTTQEKEHKITVETALEKRLGLTIRKPKTTFADMKGFEEVIEILNALDRKTREDRNFALKPIFLLGMAGTGKSRVAEAYAGEHDIPLIDLNISAVAEDEHPIQKLNEIFSVLSSFEEKVCLRLDEFEQMSKNEDLLGEMLTILNDLNKGGYSFKGMIFLTSNNISDLVYIMPQFFRHGRFSEKLFISFPKRENALKVMRYFNQKFNLNFDDSTLLKIYLSIENEYKSENFTWQEDRSPYVPAEYEALMSILKDRSFNGEIKRELLLETVKEVKPLLVTGREGVQRMYQKAKEQDFKEI